ncbi:conserved hypothetical protein [uncultured Desulfatiglans sp.]|nr:conserved hypothetical protein [uncultured Desulfatiglans sp.]
MLRILVDITHPAYVHLYKNIIRILKSQGHHVVVTAAQHEDTLKLLRSYNLEHLVLGRKGHNIKTKLLYQQLLTLRLWLLARKSDIDLALGGSTTVAQGTFFTRARSIIFTDDDGDIVPLFAKSTYPFASKVVHPRCIRDRLSKRKQVLVDSFKELAYLHPNNFQPDNSIFNLLGLETGQRFFVVRFSALKAHHDLFARGIKDKVQLIRYLENFGRVFVSSESELEGDLKKNQIELPIEMVHSLLHFASLYIGDSQTMAAEAAVLGTPSIRCNTFVGKLSYLEELENEYNLTIGVRPESFVSVFPIIESYMREPNIKNIWAERRNRLLKDKIDFTEWFVNYINSMEWIN